MQAAADPHPPAPGADSQAAAATLALGPELTIAQAALCRDQLLDALCATPGDLALDLSAVTDIDSAGMQLLLATRAASAERRPAAPGLARPRADASACSACRPGHPSSPAATWETWHECTATTTPRSLPPPAPASSTRRPTCCDQFEAALLVMESNPRDADNLNAAFRAAHTIKGTAGLFGCDAVVLFTHEVETLLEGLRNGSLLVDEQISAALLAGRDQMQALIDEVRSGGSDPAVAARSQALGAQLRRLYGGAASAAAADAPAGAPASVPGTPARDAPEAPAVWHLSLRFGADALRNGLDPLAFVRYLSQVGQVLACHTLVDEVPPLEQLDAESCCLGFEIRLRSERSHADIEGVFEFARDDCSVRILAPGTDAQGWQALLQERCAGDEDGERRALQSVWLSQGREVERPARGRRPGMRPPLRCRPPPRPGASPRPVPTAAAAAATAGPATRPAS
jgi:HPt (histidine-containing phosphotransfer) domain-containing protein/ABC-type transporter Mla MlaB component